LQPQLLSLRLQAFTFWAHRSDQYHRIPNETWILFAGKYGLKSFLHLIMQSSEDFRKLLQGHILVQKLKNTLLMTFT